MLENLKVGVRVLHRGRSDFKVVKFIKHPKGVIAQFENARHIVKCDADVLQWDGEVFFLPGRTNKMPGELTIEQAILLGLEKGNLSDEGVARKFHQFEALIKEEKEQ